ncbi:MAG TPA: hypothetical protein PKN50_10355 [Spirochaetota bacterium]|nr:hypothetical protein [Spirochaetota bacterium]HPV40509.1 hypothetical protein [Spirochaetota bacterium]
MKYPGAVFACAAVVLAAAAGTISINCSITAGARPGGPVPAGIDAAVRAAWRDIGGSRSRCEDFDYFPEGGMRNFYCHAMNFMDYRRFAELAGTPVFSGGPHTERELRLDSPDSFGHYNREFVARLSRMMIPGEKDAAFRAATQGVYDGYVRPLARIFFVTYRKLRDNPSYLDGEKRNYLAMLKSGRLEPYHYEKYFYFMNPGFIGSGGDGSYLMEHGFDGGWDGNVVKTCVAFWIRRSIDGTAGEFYAGLEKLLKTYDGGFLAESSRLDQDADGERIRN